MKWVIVVDSSFVLDAFIGSKDKLIDYTSKFIMKLIEHQDFNKMIVVIALRVQEELFKIYEKNKHMQEIIKGLFTVMKETNIEEYEKDGFGYGDAGCAAVAAMISRRGERPIILTNDESFIKRYRDRIHDVYNSRDFIFHCLIDFVCFRECKERRI